MCHILREYRAYSNQLVKLADVSHLVKLQQPKHNINSAYSSYFQQFSCQFVVVLHTVRGDKHCIQVSKRVCKYTCKSYGYENGKCDSAGVCFCTQGDNRRAKRFDMLPNADSVINAARHRVGAHRDSSKEVGK